MIFGEASMELQIFNAVMQVGALGILAYHFLRGLPEMMKAADDAQERAIDSMAKIIASKDAAYLERSKGLRLEIAELRHHIGCRYPDGPYGPFPPPTPVVGPPAKPGGSQ